MENFSVETEYISLPHSATPRARRSKVSWRGRPITVFAQGEYRAYLFPVWTPQGVAVTDESPLDHPHHNSITVGSDHVNCHFPPLLPGMTSRIEYGNYNLYVNDTFQDGRRGEFWRLQPKAPSLRKTICRSSSRCTGKGLSSGRRRTAGISRKRLAPSTYIPAKRPTSSTSGRGFDPPSGS